MNKMIMWAAVCGLLSSAAVAEPLTLNDSELETVNGGVLNISTIKDEAFAARFGLKFFHDQRVMPENSVRAGQKNAVDNGKKDKFPKFDILCECLLGKELSNDNLKEVLQGTTAVTQIETTNQNAGVVAGNVSLPSIGSF